ncbi:MAG TPA: 30S ribosomal protein S14, partial [Lentzea sp.]
MAKKSKIAADQRRREVVARYAERRAELKEMLRHPETREEALRGLQKLP